MTTTTENTLRLVLIFLVTITMSLMWNNSSSGADTISTSMDSTKTDAQNAATETEASPKSVDLRPFLQKWGLDARVQGKRETCSVFVVTEALEYALATKQQRGTRLSVEFLNWAGNITEKELPDGGCFSELWKGCEAYGICPEAEMPYLN